jgi:hypothetical protein
MGDPVAPHAAATQSYRGFGAFSRTQYQAPPQPQFAQPPQPLAPQQYQATINTYHPPGPSQPQFAQHSPPLAPQQYQATFNTYHPPGPSQPQIAQHPPPLAPQQYQATFNTYHPPGPSQPQFAQHPPPLAPQQYQATFNTYHPPGPSQPQFAQHPPPVAPQQYQATINTYHPPGPSQPQIAQPIDDVTSLLSRTHLDNHPTATTALRRLNLPPPEDGIYQVIRDVLTQDLETENNNKMICPDHPCFDISREYARKWRISNQAIDNHIRLACGYLKFPVMMLLNPSPNHERLSFDEMVRECKTLVWIQGVLREIGLTLAEVIILDICTLLDDLRIGKMDENEKDQAMWEAYNVTWEMLQMIKPKIIVSCQCSTLDRKWGGGTHEIAKVLRSSIRGAGRGQVNETYIEGHKIYVVQAYHPGGFLNHSSHKDPNGERLKWLLLRVYRPCGWELKRKQVEALVAAMNSLINRLGHIYGFAHGYLGFQTQFNPIDPNRRPTRLCDTSSANLSVYYSTV